MAGRTAIITSLRRGGVVLVAFLIVASPAKAQQPFGPRQVDSLPSRAPTLVARYGADSLNVGELRMPSGAGPFPVAVVIHGGCWTVGFATLKNTAPLASAITGAHLALWGAGRSHLPIESPVRGQNPLRVSAAVAID
jgi:hypothetical protein